MWPHLIIKHEHERKTVETGMYSVEVRRGHPDEAPIVLVRSGVGCATVEFKLNPALVQALGEAIQKLGGMPPTTREEQVRS